MTAGDLMQVLKRVDPDVELMLQLSEAGKVYGVEMLQRAVRDLRWPDRLVLQGYAEPLLYSESGGSTEPQPEGGRE